MGNKITRLLFDTALLLYVDRFCPATYPNNTDVEYFEMFVVYAFVWAYSLRAQYANLGWQSAQNYVLGKSDKKNSLNIYKLISDSDTPMSLLSSLADLLNPLSYDDIWDKVYNSIDEGTEDEYDDSNIYKNYIYYFKNHSFYTE